MKKAYTDINFPVIHFVFAWKCLMQILRESSEISTYKAEGEERTKYKGKKEQSTQALQSQERTRIGRGRREKAKCMTAYRRLESPFHLCSACAEQRNNGLTITKRKMGIAMKKTISTRKNKICEQERRRQLSFGALLETPEPPAPGSTAAPATALPKRFNSARLLSTCDRKQSLVSYRGS